MPERKIALTDFCQRVLHIKAHLLEFRFECEKVWQADGYAIRAEALRRGLVLLTCGVYGNVIRFLAPLTIPDAIFTEALDILEASIDAVKAA